LTPGNISTAGFNIYLLELVLFYLGGSFARLFNGPGRFSFEAAMVPALLDDLSADNDSDPEAASPTGALLVPVPVELNLSNQACTTWANPVALEQVSTCLEVLQEAQATGPSTGFALQIFSKGAKHCDLSQADHTLADLTEKAWP
jgi:hypothetical protein